jgi:hypothetical protein
VRINRGTSPSEQLKQLQTEINIEVGAIVKTLVPQSTLDIIKRKKTDLEKIQQNVFSRLNHKSGAKKKKKSVVKKQKS